jgi:hypothetical protein
MLIRGVELSKHPSPVRLPSEATPFCNRKMMRKMKAGSLPDLVTMAARLRVNAPN